MKKILFRKLLSDCLVFFLIILISTSVIIWVFQAVNFLDIMIEDGRNYSVYITYTLLNLPKIISRILPFALFFSFTYIFIKYEMNNELMIFWNIGINKLQLINFFFKFSILMMLIQIVLISTIVPKSQEVARTLLRTSGVDYFEGLIKPQKFNDSVKGLTIYAERKNNEGVLENIYIKKKSLNKFQITFAKEGIFETRNDTKILVLYDGQTLNSNNDKITNFKFSKSDFGIADMSTHTVTQTKIQEVSTYDLIYCIKSKITKDESRDIMNCSEANLRNVYKELYKRLIIPFYIPSLILISLLLIIKSKENIEYFKFRIFIFILGILLIILSESTLGYIEDFHLANIKFVALPFFITIGIYSIFFYKLKFKIRKLIL